MTIDQKCKLKKDIIAGFQDQADEDLVEAMLGFDDYLELINRE